MHHVTQLWYKLPTVSQHAVRLWVGRVLANIQLKATGQLSDAVRVSTGPCGNVTLVIVTSVTLATSVLLVMLHWRLQPAACRISCCEAVGFTIASLEFP